MSFNEANYNKYYFYEHTDGHEIKKPAFVVESAGGPAIYFDSPFVRRWWVEWIRKDVDND